MLGNIGFSELMIILLVVLLVFGAKRLPEIGASIGKGIREFKRSISDVGEAVNSPPDDRTQLPRSVDAPPSHTTAGGSGEPKRLSQ
jgi:sec-independent protein translocase protein TatA